MSRIPREASPGRRSALNAARPSLFARLRALKFTPAMRLFAVRLCGAVLLIGYAMVFARNWQRVGLDWREFFYPYSLAVLQGQNPYAWHHGIFVPWVLALTTPFAVLPPRLGVILLFAFTAGSFAFIAHK